MRPVRFPLNKLLAALVLFPIAMGLSAAADAGGGILHALLETLVFVLTGSYIDYGGMSPALMKFVLFFNSHLGEWIILILLVVGLTSSRLGLLRLLGALIIAAEIPTECLKTAYWLSFWDKRGLSVSNFQQLWSATWLDMTAAVVSVIGLYFLRRYIVRGRPEAQTLEVWRTTSSRSDHIIVGALSLFLFGLAVYGWQHLRFIAEGPF